MLGTYFVAGELDRERCFPFGGHGFYRAHGVQAHLRTPVVRIDPRERRLTTAGGEEYSYRECLVATGASSAVPPVPGLDGPGVVRPALVRRRRAAARRRLGGALARGRRRRRRARWSSARPSPASRSRACSAGRGSRRRIVELEPQRAAARGASGVRAGRGTAPARRRPRRPSSGVALTARRGARRPSARAARRVRPDSGRRSDRRVHRVARPTSACSPAPAWTTGAGLDVDEGLRTGAPGLLAAGDVARTLDPVSGERLTVALWSNARRQGRVAGLTMAGVDARCPGGVPCNIQHAGDQLFASAGSLAAADRRRGRRARRRDRRPRVLRPPCW